MQAHCVHVTAEALVVELIDRRLLTVPLAWFPRLLAGKPSERRNYRLIAEGEGIHWPDLDEDISIDCLLAGKGSLECAESFGKWLAARTGKRRTQAVKARRSG